MPVRNKLREIVVARGIENPNQLRKVTGLGQQTVLSIWNDPNWVPHPQTLEAICEKLDLQPGDFLWYEKSS